MTRFTVMMTLLGSEPYLIEEACNHVWNDWVLRYPIEPAYGLDCGAVDLTLSNRNFFCVEIDCLACLPPEHGEGSIGAIEFND